MFATVYQLKSHVSVLLVLHCKCPFVWLHHTQGNLKSPATVVLSSTQGSLLIMQLHQIDLVPGESIRVGNLVVTLVAVEGSVAQLEVEDPGDNYSWINPVDYSDSELAEPAFA